MWILLLKVKGYLLLVFFFADISRRLKYPIGALVSGEPSHAMSGGYVLYVMYLCTYVCVCVCMCVCVHMRMYVRIYLFIYSLFIYIWVCKYLPNVRSRPKECQSSCCFEYFYKN
jgi:hypothetical protein